MRKKKISIKLGERERERTKKNVCTVDLQISTNLQRVAKILYYLFSISALVSITCIFCLIAFYSRYFYKIILCYCYNSSIVVVVFFITCLIFMLEASSSSFTVFGKFLINFFKHFPVKRTVRFPCS